MKKDKTKSLLFCAAMTGVVVGGMPSAQAAQVNAVIMPKDFNSSLYGKEITFGQKRGFSSNQYQTFDPQKVQVIDQKPTWQIVAVDNGGMTLFAKESWGKNRYSEPGIEISFFAKYSIGQCYYSEVLQCLDDKKEEFFSAEELALLCNQTSYQECAKNNYKQVDEYNGVFALPTKQTVGHLTEEQRKRNEIYWLNDASFQQVDVPSSRSRNKYYYDAYTVETDGRLVEHEGGNVYDVCPTIRIQLPVFVYYGTKQIGQSFEKQMADSSDVVHFAVRNTRTEKNVQIRALDISVDKIQFTAHGLATGTGQGLAGILTDNDGNYVSYARLADTSVNGSVNKIITAGNNKFLDSEFAAGNYTVYLFNEKISADSVLDYVGNFDKFAQVNLNDSGAITKATIFGNRNFVNLKIAENVDFNYTAVNYPGGSPHGSYWEVESEAVKVTDSLTWENILNAEGSITLKGSFSVVNDTLTLVRPTNAPKDTHGYIIGWNDIIYDGGESKTATLHVNGKMHGLIVNGGTFTAEKNLILDDYLRINNGATVQVNGKLNVPNGEIKGTLQTGNDLNLTGLWHVYNSNKITAPNLNVKSALMLEQNAVIDGKCNVLDKGTLNVVSNCLVTELNFADGSTLEVDGNKIQDKAAITYTTGVWAADNSKLIIKNQKEGVNYKIVQKRPPLLMSNSPSLGLPTPNGGDGYADDIEDWEKIVRPAYGLALDHDASVFDEENLTLTFEEDPKLSDYSDMSNIVGGLLSEAEGMAWIEDLSYELAFWPEADIEMYLELLNNSVNTLANINTLANVQGGVSAISSFAGNSIQSNICTGSRPMLGNRGQGAALRNVAANTKDNITRIDVVEQGSADKVMPEQYNKDKFEREVWASFIHNKEKIENRKTGHLKQNSTMQYNGTIVGADLWSGKHGFGGMALTYGNGNTNSGQMISNVKNEADYYGINVYNRQDVGKYSFVYDGGFTYGKNDLTLSILGEEDITAKPKVRAYTMGFKVEEPIKISKAAEITPFMGARYTFVKTKEYKNSLEVGYDIDNQHLINMPIGLTIKGMYETKEGWKLGGTLTAGYSWNLGNREGRQKVSFGGYSDMIDFDIADKGEYFVRPTLLAEKENVTFEVGYDYSKGKTTRSNKWYVNMNFRF
ncbi:MAG: autotransporter outer membrane beta-barrel domain-containing protein [Phascolarctobacterium sp.]|nr:autotransporter outer membrane beta-barrel domain-containing protein [Candidatus Phascolarctobacterium caballi]